MGLEIGRLDDIIYAPVKAVCDMLGEPSRRKTLEHKNRLEMELREFDAKLEAERKNQDFELAAKNSKLQMDYEKFKADLESERKRVDLQFKVEEHKLVEKDQKFKMESIEQENRLKRELADHQAKLEADQKRRDMDLTIEERRLQEEINQMIIDKEVQRNKDLLDLEIKYRKEMTEASLQFAQIVSDMQVDTRRKVLALYTEKEQEYFELQNKYKRNMLATVKELKEIFPDGSGNDIIREETVSQLKLITEKSSAFAKLMNEDMKNILGLIDDGMREFQGLATKYFQPTNRGYNPALVQGGNQRDVKVISAPTENKNSEVIEDAVVVLTKK